jgi:hypothetical protein
MGYGTRGGSLGHTIRTFWPDDDENTLHIESNTCPTLAVLLEKAQEKWPGVELHNIRISAEKIHTDCLGYDLYDSSDWTDFIILTKVE